MPLDPAIRQPIAEFGQGGTYVQPPEQIHTDRVELSKEVDRLEALLATATAAEAELQQLFKDQQAVLNVQVDQIAQAGLALGEIAALAPEPEDSAALRNMNLL